MLFGNHEMQQFHSKWGYIEQYGYVKEDDGHVNPFHLPQNQIKYFEAERNLMKLKENGMFMVRIGRNVFTHSGFDSATFGKFKKWTEMELDPTLQMLNDKFRVEVKKL